MGKTVPPAAAPVRPRVRRIGNGWAAESPRLFEEEIEELLGAGRRGLVGVIGPSGSGKSSALAHVAATVRRRALEFVDEPRDRDELPRTDGLVVYASRTRLAGEHLATYCVAPWVQDDWIEYLLANHPKCCASVLARTKHAEWRSWLEGTPSVWRAVLDILADDDSVAGLPDAFRMFLHRRIGSPAAIRTARARAFGRIFGTEPDARRSPSTNPVVGEVLKLPGARNAYAADEAASRVRSGSSMPTKWWVRGRPLVDELARILGDDAQALERLYEALVAPSGIAPALAATIVHRLAPGELRARLESALGAGTWCPSLDRASLGGAQWTGARLPGVELNHAYLARARLDDADLEQAKLSGANLRNASLVRARLTGSDLRRASLVGADLSGAGAAGCNFDGCEVEGASFAGASLANTVWMNVRWLRVDLRSADLEHSVLPEADLRSTRLDGARFKEAVLPGCRLEGVVCSDLNLCDATLVNALLTGSRFERATCRAVNLRGAGLAHVDWEGADLRDADFRDASFHLGSSRSGLVFAGVSEGTRTGFYTDETVDLSHKAPEEIRKANLRGVDLRGAKVWNTDFYLVDLRDAEYTADQERHFRGCGAILTGPSRR